ncbi:FAD-dependent oxidoreductase [Intrasporangium sp.]|uniref:NAD(P)/FAD-dependent oxidoreductase n=1 Tax=Intrasporangium sp. TaxID=1925024 RepID=UPI003221903B
MPFSTHPRASALDALRDAEPTPFWLTHRDRPDPAPALTGSATGDLVVVGGGFTGLWTALLAKQDDPDRDVVLLEAGTVANAASGRNGGFCASSLTHGIANGVSRYPDEMDRLVALGLANLDEIEKTVADHDIDCGLERTGTLHVATEPHQLAWLEQSRELAERHGEPTLLLDRERTRGLVDSPLFLGATLTPSTIMLDPARLVWGLLRACRSLGVRVHERSPVTGLDGAGDDVTVRTAYGSVRARSVALATNAFPPLLRRLRKYVVPVYDYALVTEPLTAAQLESVGWAGRQGVSDSGNRFHYLRLTSDNRVLFGGYDAIYHWNARLGEELTHRPESYALLAEHFVQMFPTLEGVRFTHAWGGVIDTCSRFSAFWGTAERGRVAYALGYTGLGVGASRFGARVMLDLLGGHDTERTRLRMVRTRPVPFPPEPLRSIGIQLTQAELARADDNHGRRGLWLRALDRLGVGFDS